MTTMMTARQVRELCGGVSDMSLHRYLKNSDFPQPVYFNRRRYWRGEEVVAWWASRSEEAPPAPQRRETAQA